MKRKEIIIDRNMKEIIVGNERFVFDHDKKKVIDGVEHLDKLVFRKLDRKQYEADI